MTCSRSPCSCPALPPPPFPTCTTSPIPFPPSTNQLPSAPRQEGSLLSLSSLHIPLWKSTRLKTPRARQRRGEENQQHCYYQKKKSCGPFLCRRAPTISRALQQPTFILQRPCSPKLLQPLTGTAQPRWFVLPPLALAACEAKFEAACEERKLFPFPTRFRFHRDGGTAAGQDARVASSGQRRRSRVTSRLWTCRCPYLRVQNCRAGHEAGAA